MKRLSFPYQFRFLIVTLLILLLAGCELTRSDESGDFTPPEEEGAPPSTEESSAAAQATTEPGTESNAVISLQPQMQQINVNETTTVEIRLENVTNLRGIEVDIQFDSAVLSVQDVFPEQEGIQIQPGDFLTPSFPAENSVDPNSGVISYANLINPAGGTPITGSGVVATITFQGIAEGESQLTFNSVKLPDDQAQEITATQQTAQITVVSGEPISGATATPTMVSVEPSPTGMVTETPAPADTPTVTPTPYDIPPTPLPPPPTATAIAITEPEIPAGATIGYCYHVQVGETFQSLTQKMGLDPQYLNLVNDLNPPSYIYPQQTLFIPTEPGNGPNVYKGQSGETLGTLAEKCRLPLDAIAYANYLKDYGESSSIDSIRIIVPRPPFAPPSRYPYPPLLGHPFDPPGGIQSDQAGSGSGYPPNGSSGGK